MPETSETLTLMPGDREAVFVLAGDPDAPGMAQLLPAPGDALLPQEQAIAVLNLPAEAKPYVELINPADLTGLGLSHYLVEGLGLREEDIAPDWDRLEAIKGPVLLVQGRLAGKEGRRLELPDGLTLIGRYGPDSQPLDMMPLPAQAATGTLQPVTSGQIAPAPRSRAWLVTLISGVAVLLVLLVIALLLL